MNSVKVMFMGSPIFSVPILEELINNTNVIGVITSPDAYIGRNKILTASPVKQLAEKYNIKVYSPIKLKDDYDFIKKASPDIIITCAYGQIVPEGVLNIPRLGCINIHASLLPKYRGASPIHHALMDGEKETGITLMYMDKGLDTGDIIKSESIAIDINDNLESLSNKLSLLGAKMIIDELPNIINGTNNRIKQDNSIASYVGMIKREDEHINFNDSALNIYNKIRAFSPNPLTYFILDDKEYKIAEAHIIEVSAKEVNTPPGTIIFESKNSFIIKTIDEGIMITKIKPMGKKIMDVASFKNGYHDSLLGKVVK